MEKQKERLAELLFETGMLESEHRCVIAAGELLANGVIVSPCKPGDEVYVADKGIVELVVKYVDITEDGIEIVIFPEGKKLHGYSFKTDKIGKTVFLTREEAEQALKGGAE